jgi:hypothetical protein
MPRPIDLAHIVDASQDDHFEITVEADARRIAVRMLAAL